MLMIMCCVRDRGTDSFGNPFSVVAVGQAVRGFSDEINKAGSDLNRHPEDYDLYHLGTYDTDTGLFKTDVPRMIAVGKDCVIKGV